MINPSLLQLVALLSLYIGRVFCLSVSIPVSAPSTAPTIAPDLLSLSIEQDRWTDWSGTTSRNSFFVNTLNNLVKLTGVPPRIRIGADSEDHTNFNPNVQFSQVTFPAPSATKPYQEASHVVVGDGYYQTAQFLPPNTHVTWGVNFKSNNMTATFLQAQSIFKAFSSKTIANANIILDGIEIGNRQFAVHHIIFAPSLAEYVQRWTTFATNITEIPSNLTTKFWAGAFASSSRSTTGFSPQGLIASGILSTDTGARITTMSQHHYSGSFCTGSGGLLQNLMTKNTIQGNLTFFKSDITATKAKGLDYVMGETNSYSCHGAPGVSDTAGAAIWMLDYALFGSQIGIARMYFHAGVGYKYNLLQPATLTRSTLDGTTLETPLPPHIQPQYYGAIVAAEAIGHSGATRAVELSINDTFTSGYAFYDGDKLARAVLINSQAFLTNATTARTSTPITLNFTDSNAPTNMTVKRLFIPHADSTSGLTWGGQTYETTNGKVSGTLSTTKANVSEGISMQETEIVLLSFQ
ncbi:hypothetical protein GALMADRAFT_72693 [Galerina marginata CBS 339.88]|uniref:Beta-glucuronidase C-terminal domain-containing protein n=1 Tax=Galerina marginata (strain CBS 339.88) TaxID=685588 RepID=A0A067STF6_GALM3|nr:hypothetical protein GALMADRAFT_72693 [Galerina marginata CBS 339.88]